MPPRSTSVRRLLQIIVAGVAVAALILGTAFYALVIPRVTGLRTDTQRLIDQIQSIADQADRLATAVHEAQFHLSEGGVALASRTIASARAETTASSITSARDAMMGAPLEMQTALAAVLSNESSLRDYLSEAGALLELGRTDAAGAALIQADSVGDVLVGSLAAAQRAGLVDVGRRSGSLDALSRSVARTMLFLAGAGILGVLLIMRILRLRLTQPLARLDAGFRAVSSGELDVELEVGVDDEVGRLSTLFNRMVRELQQRELEQEAERMEMTRRILDASLDAVVTVTAGGRIVEWNPGAERIFGWSADEARGRSVSELIFPEPRLASVYFDLDATDGVGQHGGRRVEMALHRRDGRVFTAELSLVPVTEGGRAVAVAGFIRDLTETLELQEQVRRSQRLDAVGRLAGGIAHDFNNLMSVILGQTQLALETMEDHEAQENLREVERAAYRAAELTSQLLAFARKRMAAPRVADVNDLVRETLEMVSPAVEASVRIVRELDEDAGSVNVDPGHFSQVLVNLLMNARDAMASGRGAVTVSTARVDLPDEGGPLPGGSYVVISVADEGPGIPPEAEERIFEPFFSTKLKGTGLGLATCHGIARQAGGAIAARNRPGGGAEFVVHLPRVS